MPKPPVKPPRRRRNPVARRLAQAAFQARQVASRKLYRRRAKHRGRELPGPGRGAAASGAPLGG